MKTELIRVSKQYLRIKSANMVRVVGHELPRSRDARIPHFQTEILRNNTRQYNSSYEISMV